MRRFGATCVLATLTLLALGLYKLPVEAETQASCDPYRVIYARGSGQLENNQPERDTFYQQLELQGLDRQYFVELDSTEVPSQLGYTYRAEGIVNINGPIALISRGNFGNYSSSVDDGKELLIEYILKSNFLACGTKLIMAGYSQGAHVVGEAISDTRLSSYMSQISYVATFGDPSLDINTVFGGDVFAKTPWYRGSAVKYISGGIVNVRNPYIPSEIQDRAGAWCDPDDMICTGNVLKFLNEIINEPHSNYPSKAIPDAAREIAARLREDLQKPFTGPECGALQQDIVLAINMSPSMRSDDVFFSSDGIKKTVESAFESGCDVRVGLVEFGRIGVDPTRPVLDFTSDPSIVTQTLWSYKNEGAPVTEIEKADVLGGIGTAMDFTWRESAQKAILVVSDAAGEWYGANNYRDYETRFLQAPAVADIIKESRERGGVEVYAVKLDHSPTYNFTYKDSDAVDFYGQILGLVTKTAGHIGELKYCGQCTWLDRGSNFKARLADKPVVTVAPVRIKEGESIELTAHDTYGIVAAGNKSQPWSYRWYVTCGNVLDSIAGEASVVYRPTRAGNCTGAVEVSQSLGYCDRCYEGLQKRRAVTTFPIEVLLADYVTPPTPGPVRNITKEYLRSDKILRVSWEAPENADDVGEMAYIIKDSDGNIVGVTTATKLHITDVEPNNLPIVTVNTVSANGVSENVSTDDAVDLTQPDQEDAAGGVLSASDEQQLRTLPSGIPTVTPVGSAPPRTGDTAVQGVQIADVHTFSAPGVGATPAVTPPASLHSPSVSSAAKQPLWLQFTIVAVPLALLTSVGVAVKHGVLLKFKR